MAKSRIRILLTFVLVGVSFAMLLEFGFAPVTSKLSYYEYVVSLKWVGAVIFLTLFSLLGSVVYLKKEQRPKKIGFYSWALGFLFEFWFMRPEWVQRILGEMEFVAGDVFGALIITSFYWFMIWFLPSYLLQRKQRFAPAPDLNQRR